MCVVVLIVVVVVVVVVVSSLDHSQEVISRTDLDLWTLSAEEKEKQK